jgi:serine/threonine protein phosphatase PrpC
MACKQLVELAKRRGGEDNITVIIAAFEGEGLAPESNDPQFRNSIKIVSSFYPIEEDSSKAQSFADPGFF